VSLFLATGWTVRESNPGGGKIFRTHPGRPWDPPGLLHNGYRVFPGGKAAGAWRWPSTPSSSVVKERVELYLYSHSGPSLFVLWTSLCAVHFVGCYFVCDAGKTGFTFQHRQWIYILKNFVRNPVCKSAVTDIVTGWTFLVVWQIYRRHVIRRRVNEKFFDDIS